jgi:Smg protein
MTHITGSVLDILIYVFDRYMLSDGPEVPERDELAQDLERAGFEQANVERALDWLADLAGERSTALPNPLSFTDAALDGAATGVAEGSPVAIVAAPTSMRVFTDGELSRLSAECRGYLMSLERTGILSALQREIVIDRLLALENEELDVEQLKWVVLMVLSSQPGAEAACSRMEDIVWGSSERPH